jgi:hypothetical protein
MLFLWTESDLIAVDSDGKLQTFLDRCHKAFPIYDLMLTATMMLPHGPEISGSVVYPPNWPNWYPYLLRFENAVNPQIDPNSHFDGENAD